MSDQFELKQGKDVNEMNFGKHLSGYLTYQLPMADTVKNQKVIDKIATMSYEQLQRFDIKVTPVVDENMKIISWNYERVLKSASK